MVQIRPGDLIAAKTDGVSIHFAVLTKQILFGGHWRFAFYDLLPEVPPCTSEVAHIGFNAFVDFIQAKREASVAGTLRNDRHYGHRSGCQNHQTGNGSPHEFAS